MKAIVTLILLVLLQALLFFPPNFKSSTSPFSSYSLGPPKAQALIRRDGVLANFTFFSGYFNLTGIVDIKQGLTMDPISEGYTWLIYDKPVGRNGNCDVTGAVFDPFGRQQNNSYHCTNWNDCQLGDLTGKFGKLKSLNNTIGRVPAFEFKDPTLSFTRKNSILGKSLVILDDSARPWVCANITAVDDSDLPTPATAAPAANLTMPSVALGIIFLAAIVGFALNHFK